MPCGCMLFWPPSQQLMVDHVPEAVYRNPSVCVCVCRGGSDSRDNYDIKITVFSKNNGHQSVNVHCLAVFKKSQK